MSNLYDERDVIAGKLTGAGVAAVTTDRTMAPPRVFIGMPTGAGENIGLGAWRCAYPITVTALQPGDEVAARTLGLSAFDPINTGDDELPAYRMTARRDVNNPDC
jgi:hypothetical protein